MLTCCPACRTCFRITEAQLAVAQGKVRCGKCKTVFNARQHLQPVPGQSPPASSTASTTPAGDQTDHIDLFRAPQSEERPPAASDEAASTGIAPTAAGRPPEPESDSSDDTESDVDAVSLMPSADQSGPTTPAPFKTDETPDVSATEQAQPAGDEAEPEIEADEPEPEPATVEMPMPDLAERKTDAVTDSPAGSESVSEPEEPETEPATVEMPMPDLEERETDAVTESPADSESVSEPEEPEPEPISATERPRYQYNEFTDEVLSDRELDDILAEMDQQLSLGIDNPDTELPGSLALPDEPPPTEPDELGEAIDSLFDDIKREPSADEEPAWPAPKTADAAGTATTGPGEAATPQAFEDELEDWPIDQVDEADTRDETAPQPPPTLDEEPEPVPLRLRESLAIEPPEPRSWLATLGGSLLFLILVALLIGQLALFRPLDVVRYVPQSQPWLEQFCQQLPCRFTPYRDTDRLRLLNRDVRAHPDQDDALLISATLVNEAEVAQAYPAVRVTLFDLSGNRVARRRFTPADYLGERHSPFMQMQPDTPLQIKLEVADPGSEAVNFEFDFQ
ncbi:DUF3426 domain-containing protein [Thiohalophilus sp.]|uniref:DUF3426 domain-containing protein n=1 Tax=Thiohalophilus sp. TaxID=3028392 RepID=UPI002ACF01F5|nr:DUF3426 domain-containing protein [Thiohalophilus sp.]MDZ7805402.1 DUF3426 domain-containing protein [Thiohalophilus sp.]